MNKNQGFSLLELMISLTIGLVLLAGVLSIFVGMKTTNSQTSSQGALQENGRFALTVLTDDLLREGFWGDMPDQLNTTAVSPIPALAGQDCVGNGLNNATFPVAVGYFRSLWSITAVNANPMGCINDAKVNSDVLQIKRVLSRPIVGNTDNNQYFLNANASSGVLFVGVGGGTPPLVNNGQIWQYQHHVYYVRDEAQGAETIPVLMQGVLSVTNGMRFAPLIEGVEMVRYLFGVDTTGDGAVNAYIPTNIMASPMWDKSGNNNILSVKIFVLVRNILPDNNYTNTKTYQVGNFAFVANDNYRRLLLTTTVSSYNAR
ncbi:MAG: PilW family protein [Colwellia sp.]